MGRKQPKVSAPTIEHHPDGLGIGHRRPRISWRFALTEDNPCKGWEQYAYDIEVKYQDQAQSELYHIQSSQSVLVTWPSKSLNSRDEAVIRVRAYGKAEDQLARHEKEDVTDWSPWARVEATLLERKDWEASFITSASRFQEDNKPLRPIRFRKQFSLPGKLDSVVKARLYATSLGVYEAYINGSRVGSEAMAPGWTSYHHRLNFQTFDVTSLLQAGNNVISVEVGEGWYATRLSVRGGKRYVWGDELAALAQLDITLGNGEIQTVASDDTWKCNASAILTSEVYDGEVYDMRQEQAGWNSFATDFDDRSWCGVKVLPFTQAKLAATDAPPVRITEEIAPINIQTSPSGKTIVDFGQNLVGVPRINSVTVPRDSQITLKHAEVLEKDGELATRPLRQAKCTDIIISSGEELRNWWPKYTFHGFRYMQVEGWPSSTSPTKADFTALVLHTDMRRRGWFSCSDELVNQLHSNIVWGMRGNFLSVPTDCPQRDERLGWLGDIQIFTPTATFLYDTVGMLSGWLQDVAAEQLAKGTGVPGSTAPDVLPLAWQQTPQAVWHDATVLTPWDLYSCTRDVELLRRQYDSMKAWLDQGIRRGSDCLWHPDLWQLGDWLDPAAPGEDPGRGRTDGIFVANAYLVRVTSTFAKVCEVLGHTEEAASYAADAARLKRKFQQKYITPDGLLVNNTQTAVSLAIAFNLYPGDAKVVAANTLSRLVRQSKFCISTGLPGTSVIAHSLTATGQTPLAYRMLLEKNCPSFLYPVTMGATTIWERWDCLFPDGTVNPDWMVSFNHYALGSVGSWLHSTVAGISSTDGWKTVIVRPEPGGTIHSVEGSFDGPYGLVKSSWRIDEKKGTFTLDLTIPPNSTAEVTLPKAQSIGVSGNKEKNTVLVGSGKHTFTCGYEEPADWPPKPFLPFFRPEGFSWTKYECF